MNNFQINLLSEEELQADAPLSKRSLLRVALPVVPLIILVAVGMIFLSSRKKNAEYRDLQQTNQSYHLKQKQYKDGAALSRKYDAIRRTLEDWQHAQLLPALWLQQLPDVIPATFQIRKLSMDLKMGTDAKTKRKVARTTVILDCVAAPEVTWTTVQTFVDGLEVSEHVNTATEYGYRESTNDDGSPGLRSFRVTCEMREVKAP